MAVDRNIRKCEECRWFDECQPIPFTYKYPCLKNHGNRYKSDDATRCPDREKYQKSSSWHRSGWYITTLIFKLLGDDPNLSNIYLALYYLKDNYLDFNPEYGEFLKDYEEIAPSICTKIMAEDNPNLWARDILNRFLIPCAYETKEANFEDAASIYMNMFMHLKEYFKLTIAKAQVLKRVRVKPNCNLITE